MIPKRATSRQRHLTADDVRMIRGMHGTICPCCRAVRSSPVLAGMFDVSRITIYHIVKRITWKDVE